MGHETDGDDSTVREGLRRRTQRHLRRLATGALAALVVLSASPALAQEEISYLSEPFDDSNWLAEWNWPRRSDENYTVVIAQQRLLVAAMANDLPVSFHYAERGGARIFAAVTVMRPN